MQGGDDAGDRSAQGRGEITDGETRVLQVALKHGAVLRTERGHGGHGRESEGDPDEFGLPVESSNQWSGQGDERRKKQAHGDVDPKEPAYLSRRNGLPLDRSLGET